MTHLIIDEETNAFTLSLLRAWAPADDPIQEKINALLKTKEAE